MTTELSIATQPQPKTGAVPVADPIATEVLKHSLNSAAEQMKRAVMRTAFSPMLYEVIDFAVGIYDRRMRMLAQAPTLPIFMGTLSFCVEAAVEAIGGERELHDGDTLLYNVPYGTGAHQNDAALITPVFFGDQLIGYSVVKAHWMDIAAKDPYSTDTVDVFQEGTIYPGVKLFERGERSELLWRIIMANSRLPEVISGDISAMQVSTQVGANELVRVVERFGLDAFNAGCEQIYAHGERVVREQISRIPDGVYRGSGQMDRNGVDDDLIPFEVIVDVRGEELVVDFRDAPESQGGPVNCPRPSTVAATRVAIAMVAGGAEQPNEGHFRPITVLTRPGSMFEPMSPAPCYLYAWAAFQAIEAIYNALSQALPQLVPACSGGDICGFQWWGYRAEGGGLWVDGGNHPVGQGGWYAGDGATTIHHGEAGTRLAPAEVWESRNPWLFERWALATDSCGAGQFRGGVGFDIDYRLLEDAYFTSTLERTRTDAWGIDGGLPGRRNGVSIEYADGTRTGQLGKGTRIAAPEGSVVRIRTGGGAGYGDPALRSIEAIARDLRNEYVSEDYVKSFHPAALKKIGIK